MLNSLIKAYDERFENPNFPLVISASWQIYDMRRYLESLVHMYRVTKDEKYVARAAAICVSAMNWGESRERYLSNWPDGTTFPSWYDRLDATHSQTYDFQGAVGMLLACKIFDDEDLVSRIYEYVNQIVVKWLGRTDNLEWFLINSPNPNIPKVLDFLGRARAVRTHFADICHRMIDTGFHVDYESLFSFLMPIYNTIGEDIYNLQDVQYYDRGEARKLIWFIDDRGGLKDTSHGNRAVWFLCSYGADWLKQTMATHFRSYIWRKNSGLFCFADYVNGEVAARAPFSIGNVWFGWHRLAEYDPVIAQLFVHMGRNLAEHHGDMFPRNSQNVEFQGSTCLIAIAARLLYEGLGVE